MRLNPRRRAKRRQQLQIAKNEAILRGPPPKPDPLSDPYVAAINAKTAQYQAQVEMHRARVELYGMNVKAMMEAMAKI